MRNRRNYADGYLPKIAYHLFKLNEEKVQHFTKRQVDTYGELTKKDREKVLNMVRDHINNS